MNPNLRKLAAGAALGLSAATIILAVASAGLLDTAELKLYDWRMRSTADPSSVNKDIVLVGISDTTIRDLQPLFGHWPWPRVALSYVIDFLHRAPAKVIAVDITLSERDRVLAYDIGGDTWKGAESDKALADSVRQSGNVIMLADAVSEGLRSGEQDKTAASWKDPGYHVGAVAEPRPVIEAPFQELTDASAALGHNFLVLDPDGPARRIVPFVNDGTRAIPSLGVAAALAARGVAAHDVSATGDALRLGSRTIPLTRQRVTDPYDARKTHDQWSMLIGYRAPALLPDGRQPYPSYEFRKLFLSEQQMLAGQAPLLNPSLFANKIVFLGFTASGLVDVFNTPFGRSTMPGIQLHASVADSILSGHVIAPASGGSRIAAVIAIACSIGLLAAFLPFSIAAIASVVLLGAWTAATVAAFGQGHWVNLVQPLASGALALFAGTAYQYAIEGREKRKVSRLFGRYVSKDVYAHLMANPDTARLGGTRRDMTVLFSDIRGFTAVTERGDPELLVGQLNEYFTVMVEIVFRHHGTLDKFVGDMVMALFSAPLDDRDHAEHAVQTAVEMVQALAQLNQRWTAEGQPALDIGIGINSGDMIAGNIGSSAVMSYTVIGDNVNLGARLESLNKDYGTRIIISDATRVRLTGQHPLRPLGDVVVKGKSRPVAIFEVQVPSPLAQHEGAHV
jgi:adenylate cyclase